LVVSIVVFVVLGVVVSVVPVLVVGVPVAVVVIPVAVVWLVEEVVCSALSPGPHPMVATPKAPQMTLNLIGLKFILYAPCM
jgi:hypothetical protein